MKEDCACPDSADARGVRADEQEKWHPLDAADTVVLHAPRRLNLDRSGALVYLRLACDQGKIPYVWPRRGWRSTDWLSAPHVRVWFQKKYGYPLPQTGDPSPQKDRMTTEEWAEVTALVFEWIKESDDTYTAHGWQEAAARRVERLAPTRWKKSPALKTIRTRVRKAILNWPKSGR